MALHETIISDLTSAMKSRDMKRVEVLRLLKAALLNAVKEKGAEVKDKQVPVVLSDERVVEILRSEVKKRKESIEAFQKGGRNDLVEKEQVELLVIQEYLPEPLSEEKIIEIVKNVIVNIGGNNFGAIMSASMKEVNGEADGKVVRQIVEKLISNK